MDFAKLPMTEKLAGVRLLYLGALERKKDADGDPTGSAGLIFAAPFFLDLASWPVFVKNAAVSAARVVDAAVQGGAPEPKSVHLALFMVDGWRAARGFAIVDGEAVIGWRYAMAGREDSPVIIEAERGDAAVEMLEQIAAVQVSP